MKNKKGFTLVELLAAIVILGLLVTFAFPTITRMVFKSREKIYIADAQKLVAHAEYKIRANNTEIEKPDPGNCIVLSLLYLDNQDFENSPYEGAYQREKSFVVVKNTGSELQYSVMLVEKKKDGNYRGVYLVTNDKLYSSGSTSLVVDFDEDELIYVESIDGLYINNYLGGDYIDENGEISAIYNNAVIADESVVDESSPRIMSAKLVSSSKPFNTLDATLTLKAEDGDTPLSDLMVYLSTTGYQETNGEPYGDEYTSFFHDFDFASEGYGIGNRITLYVLVKDPDGNKDRKKIIYEVHSNTAPVIGSSSVTKRPSDAFASLTGVLTVDVEDDYDPLPSLQVCLDDSINSDPITECNNYQSYSSVFDSNNQMEYTFTNCNGPCSRDGLTHYLTIFVKDTMGLVSSKTLTYDTTANAAPTFTESVTVTSKEESFTSTGSKNVTVRVRASDDADSLGHLKVSINDGVSGVVEYDMRDNADDNNFDYVIVGSYDGSTRDITVTVTDSEGQSASQTVSYVLYRDTSPTINSFNVESADVPCVLQSWCPGDTGGSKNALFTAGITDDIDSVDELMVCVSENEADCIVEEATGNEPEGYTPFINEHYVSFAEYYGKHVPITVNASSYDGSTHTFYLYVVDSYGNTVHNSFNYKIYENQPPIINYLIIESAGVDKFDEGSLHVKLDITMEDDYDTIDNMLVDIVDNENTIVSNQPLKDYIDGTQIIHLGGTYDGSVHNINVTVRDSYGAGVNQLTEYQVYQDSPPVIDSFKIYSREPACKNPLMCPIEQSGKYEVYYEVDAYDDLDDDSEVSICVSESETCTNYQPLSSFRNEDGPIAKEYTFTPIDPNNLYDGSTKKLYVFAKDSVNSEIVEASATYKIYKKQPPKIFSGPSYHGYRDENNMALPIVWYELFAAADNDDPNNHDDDLQIQYCYTKNDDTTEYCTDFMPFTSRYILNNANFFHQTTYTGRTRFNIYAKLVDADGATTTTNEYKFMPLLDAKPVIESVDAVPATGKNIDVTFLVSDYNDTYQVCISKTDSCDEDDYLTTVYDGTDKQYHTVTYRNDNTNTSNVTLYFFVRDSKWDSFTDKHIVSTSVVSNPYTQCSQPNFSKKPKIQYSFLQDKTYTVQRKDADGNPIPVLDDNGNPIPVIDENGNSILDGNEEPLYETVTYNNQEISMDRCGGKCFESNPVSGDSTSNIFGYYNKTITYYDRFSPNVLCSSNPVTTEYEASCAFIDCFKKNDNYNRQNIFGAYLFHDDVQWTITINGNTYVNHSHYKRYTSSYTDGDEKITLTEVPNTNGICPKCVEDGLYDYKTNDNEPYIRITENINDPFFAGGSQ